MMKKALLSMEIYSYFMVKVAKIADFRIYEGPPSVFGATLRLFFKELETFSQLFLHDA